MSLLLSGLRRAVSPNKFPRVEIGSVFFPPPLRLGLTTEAGYALDFSKIDFSHGLTTGYASLILLRTMLPSV